MATEFRSKRLFDGVGVLVAAGVLAWIPLGLLLSHDDLPSCSSVWIAGRTLPDDYSGCEYPSGAAEGSTGLTCKDDRVLFHVGAELHAYKGGTIHSDFDSAYQECTKG